MPDPSEVGPAGSEASPTEVLVEAAAALSGATKLLDAVEGKGKEGKGMGSSWSRWEEQDKIRQEQVAKEYENVQAHRKEIERLQAESNKLYAEEVASHKAWRESIQKQDEERLRLVKREVEALEGIATALKK